MTWFKNHFGMAVSVIMTTILSACMVSVAMPAFHMEINAVTWYTNFCVSFFSLLLTGILLPVNRWGSELAKKLHRKPQTVGYSVIANLVPALVFNTVATFVLPGVNILGNEHIPAEIRLDTLLGAAISGWPLMFAISFVLAIIGEGIAVKMALRLIPNMQSDSPCSSEK